MSAVQAIVTFFSTSNKAILHLEEDGTHKIEKFSSTRFAITTWVFISIHNAFDRICKLIREGKFEINSTVCLKSWYYFHSC